MPTEHQHTQPRVNAPMRAMPYLPIRERLAIGALVTAANMWIGMAQVIPDDRRRVNRAQQETT